MDRGHYQTLLFANQRVAVEIDPRIELSHYRHYETPPHPPSLGGVSAPPGPLTASDGHNLFQTQPPACVLCSCKLQNRGQVGFFLLGFINVDIDTLGYFLHTSNVWNGCLIVLYHYFITKNKW